MLPRLEPRPRRSGPGMENALPTHYNTSTEAILNAKVDCDHRRETNGLAGSSVVHVEMKPVTHRPPLPFNQSTTHSSSTHPTMSPPITPLSSTVPTEDTVETPIPYVGQYRHTLNCSYSSSSSVDSALTSNSDVTLTPPIEPSQSLAIAAKRHSIELRAANNTKRRRRRRQQYTEDAEPSILVSATTDPRPSRSFDDNQDDAIRLHTRRPSLASELETHDSLDESKNFPGLVAEGQMLSPEERTRKYWEWCYGKGTFANASAVAGSFSAKRLPPQKGCLPDGPREVRSQKRSHHVQFGSPTAAEYDVESCSKQLTPMPKDTVKGKYSMTRNPTQEEEEMTMETKHNNAILSEWDDIDTPRKKSHKRDGRQRIRKSRRESSLFLKDVSVSLQNNTIEKDEGPDDRPKERTLSIHQGDTQSLRYGEISENLAPMQMSSQGDEAVAAGSVDLEDNTWEWAANLHSFHESGAACTLATALNNESQQRQRLNEASTTKLWQDEACNGGALHAARDGTSASFVIESKETATLTNGNLRDLHRLYQRPSYDLELSERTSLRMLSCVENVNKSNLLVCLLQINPSLWRTIACLMDERLTEADKLTPSAGDKSSSEASAEQSSLDHWCRLEVAFLLDVIDLLKAAECNLLESFLTWEKSAAKVFDAPRLELEIKVLEKEIEGVENEIAASSAALGPSAFLHCHATSWLCLLGFQLETFDDTEFVLRWDHILGISALVIFRTDAPQDFVVRRFYSIPTEFPSEMRDQLISGSQLLRMKPLEELGCIDFRATLLKLSRVLSKLDRILGSIRKAQMTPGISLSIDATALVVSVYGKGMILHVTLDEALSVSSVSSICGQGSDSPLTLDIHKRGSSFSEYIEGIIRD